MDQPGKVIVRFRAGTRQEFTRASVTVEHGALVVLARGGGVRIKKVGYPLDLVQNWEYEPPEDASVRPPRLPGDL